MMPNLCRMAPKETFTIFLPGAHDERILRLLAFAKDIF
jgi:hypothetical protein